MQSNANGPSQTRLAEVECPVCGYQLEARKHRDPMPGELLTKPQERKLLEASAAGVRIKTKTVSSEGGYRLARLLF